MPNYIDINPKLLHWAMNRSELSVEDFSESVDEWLTREKAPTLRQLESFANRAMVPIGYLFLDVPPHEDLPVPDYRTRKNDAVRRPSPNLIDTIFEMEYRQDWMREYLVEEGAADLPFVGSAKLDDSITAVADDMRNVLGLQGDWAVRCKTWEDALRHIRLKVEAAGILIFASGVVGNNTSRTLDPDEFQGFVLVDQMAPLVFLNSADFKVAQMFTMAHELAHVWIGESALFDLNATISSGIKIEAYCNAVAAEFLVPEPALKEVWEPNNSLHDLVTQLSARFKVSRIVLLRCAKDAELITGDQFFELIKPELSPERRANATKRSGGNFWHNQNLRVGRRFGTAIINAAKDGRLSYSDAYQLTNLYGKSFDRYADMLETGDD